VLEVFQIEYEPVRATTLRALTTARFSHFRIGNVRHSVQFLWYLPSIAKEHFNARNACAALPLSLRARFDSDARKPRYPMSVLENERHRISG
jgi:hypothetical protein